MLCKLCNRNCGDDSDITEIRVNETTFLVYFCHKCQTGFTNPIPPEVMLKSYYAAGVYRTGTGRRFIAPLEILVDFFIRLKVKRLLKGLKAGSTVLDIGCGRGDLLIQMQKEGMRVAGTEIDPAVREYLRKKNGIIVYQGLSAIDSESVDLITLHHVLEHIQDPNVVLQSIAQLLKKDGSLIVAVPNYLSMQAKFGKKEWFHLDLPHHLYHFSEAGLSRLLRVHGFRVNEIRHFDAVQNTFGWLQTLLNRSGLQRNLLYDLLKNRRLKTNIVRKTRALNFIAMILLLPLFVPLALLLSLFEAAVRRGGTIELHATKGGTDISSKSEII